MFNQKRKPRCRIPCCIPGCEQPRHIFGRCAAHIRELKSANPAECARIAALSRAEKEREFHATRNPPPPRWEYEPSPAQTAELIKTYGKQTRKNVKVGFGSRPASEAVEDLKADSTGERI
jgi:hypothetical protein